MGISTYVELYVRPEAKLETWWLKCRKPCDLLNANGTELYWASVAANNTALQQAIYEANSGSQNDVQPPGT